MGKQSIDLTALRRALAMLQEALAFWQAQPDGSALKPHLRSAVIQSFEFSYELSVRVLRRVLTERAAAADAGLLEDPLRWRDWRELRNATSHAYDEAKAQAVALGARTFFDDAPRLLAAMEAALGD